MWSSYHKPQLHLKGVLRMTLNYIWWRGSNSRNLRNEEFPFMAITFGSTLIQNGSICLTSLGKSYRSVWKFQFCIGMLEIIWLCSNKWVSLYRLIGLVGRVFTNGPGDLGSIQGRVIPKTLKIVLDTSLLNTQQYKVHIKSKVQQSRERSSTLPNTSV